MFFSRKQKEEEAGYPAVPDSLRADSVDIAPEIRNTQQARAETAPTITPYLGLRSRLSQVWANRWTILLLLILLRVMLSIVSLDEDVNEANSKALRACTKVEDVGSAMASMPHYLSVGVNEMSAMGIEKTVDALVAVLGLVITGVQELIIFVIEMVTSMYTCLIIAFVESGLEAAAFVTEKVTDAMNSAISGIANTIGDRAGDVEDFLNDIKGPIEDSFLGGVLPDIPDIDLTGPVDELRNIKISDDFVDDIKQLREDMPSFDEVRNMTREAIRTPFRLLKDKINEEFDDFRFDRSIFPVAQKQSLAFCSGNNAITDFFEHLRSLIRTARIVFIVVITVLAILVMVPMAWYEIMRWRRQREHARLVSDHGYDPMDVIYIASRPTSASWGVKIASRFDGKRQILVRWAWAYATSFPALFILALAIAGLFACACQAILLKIVQDQVPALAAEVGEFADDVVSSLAQVSDDWAASANGVVLSAQDDINNDLLGWAREATGAVNDTLNTFTDTMRQGLETVFNNTILHKPITDVIRCTIGLKIEAVQSGLTWVHDHAKVTFPMLPNDTFSAGAQESLGEDSDMTTFLATPSSVTTDEVTGAVQYVVDKLRHHIIIEALISLGVLLVYIIIVLIGVIRALVGMAAPGGRAEGIRYTGDKRAPISPRQHEHGSDERFPRFGASEASGIDHHGGHYASEHTDEKVVTVPGGRARAVQSPTRISSYGQFESSAPPAGKF